MSVFEDLRSIQQRVDERLKELEPLVAEYQELARVAERLRFEVSEPQPREATVQPVAKPAVSTRSAKKAAAKRPLKPKPAARRAARKKPAARRTASQAAVSSRTRPGGTRATGAERRERVISLIRENPGITVPEIGRELGVEPPPLYRVVRKLQADGVVKKNGMALQLV
jgi:hypothetical protein